uniref:Uncharacterized protein n=1 Tax=Megaselia scalaris TaxID=36166 RepID=T1GWK2_MEGSC
MMNEVNIFSRPLGFISPYKFLVFVSLKDSINNGQMKELITQIPSNQASLKQGRMEIERIVRNFEELLNLLRKQLLFKVERCTGKQLALLIDCKGILEYSSNRKFVKPLSCRLSSSAIIGSAVILGYWLPTWEWLLSWISSPPQTSISFEPTEQFDPSLPQDVEILRQTPTLQKIDIITSPKRDTGN